LQSVTCQVRVMSCGHVPLVVVLMMMSVMLVPQHAFVACGSSKCQAEPHSTVLLAGQMMVPGGQGGLVRVFTLNAILRGTPCRSFMGFHATGNGALPQTAMSL